MSYPPQPPQQPPQPPQYPPQYQQPYGQQPYGQYQPPVQPRTSPLALVGFFMALACVVLAFWPVPMLGWLLNLTAFILSIIANGQIKNSRAGLTGKGFAVAGIVISSVIFVIWLIFIVLIVVAGAAILGGLGGLGGLSGLK